MTALIPSAVLGDQITTIAGVLYNEARGESSFGKEAVASVIWNRSKMTGKSFSTVCLESEQFSNKRIAQPKNKIEWDAYKECISIAKRMINNEFKPVINSTHFHSKTVNPEWSQVLVDVMIIGNHKFGRMTQWVNKSILTKNK